MPCDTVDGGVLVSGFLPAGGCSEDPVTYFQRPVLISIPASQASSQASGCCPGKGSAATRGKGCAQEPVPDTSPQFTGAGFETTRAEW